MVDEVTTAIGKVGDSYWAVYRISPLELGHERTRVVGEGDMLDEAHARDLAKEWTEEKGEPSFGIKYEAVEQIAIGFRPNGLPICVDKPKEAV